MIGLYHYRVLLCEISGVPAYRVTEWVGLWTRPETRVVCVGGQEGVVSLLLHPAIRNTRHALYIAAYIKTDHLNKAGDYGVN